MKRPLIAAALFLSAGGLSACGTDARMIVYKEGTSDLQARADYRACADSTDRASFGLQTDYTRVNHAKACMKERGYEISYAEVGAPRPKDLNGNPMWPGTQVVQ